MPRTVAVGLDGSRESLAAVEWAAREAGLLGAPLKLVQVWDPVPVPATKTVVLGAETRMRESERIAREAAEGVRLCHPGLDVTTEQVPGRPAEILAEAAKDAGLLVLGSRGLSTLAGFMAGTVGPSVVAHAERPVVLVRAPERVAHVPGPDPVGTPSTGNPDRSVLLGLDDVENPADDLIGFAVAAAERHGTSLRVVHGWNPHPSDQALDRTPAHAPGLPADPWLCGVRTHRGTVALTQCLRSWRERYPDVEVVEESLCGTPGDHLVEASHDAALVVVGRRIRRSPFGTHIGPVTHALLRHSAAPVAVVPHT